MNCEICGKNIKQGQEISVQLENATPMNVGKNCAKQLLCKPGWRKVNR